MASARGRRYARAIFELAQEEKDLDGWSRRVEEVRELFATEELRQLVSNPSLPPTERVRLVETVAGKRLDEKAMNLARLLTSTGAVSAIDDVADAYRELVDAAQNRVRATAVAAVEIPQREWDRVAKDLSERLGKEIKLEVRVDPEVIGGVLFEIGDRVIDGTVAGRLQQLRRALVTTGSTRKE